MPPETLADPDCPAMSGGPPSGLILIVEDNDTNALILRAMLRKAGYATELAADGVQGVEMAGRLRPRLILMDLHMPRLDGLEAAAAIERLCAPRTPAMVAVTANANPEVHAACMAAGFRAVLAKPILLEALVATVRRFVPLPDASAPRGA